jgi:hypothetical protein
MAPSASKKKHAVQRKNLKKIYRFSDEDRDDAVLAVKRISQLAMKNVLNSSSRSVVIDFDALETSPCEPNPHLSSMNINGEYSRSSNLSQERTIPSGAKISEFQESKNSHIRIESHDRSDNVTPSRERPTRIVSGIRRRKKKNAKSSPETVDRTLTGNNSNSLPTGAWICGICNKRFASHQDACQHEDYHIREIVSDLGWAQTSLDVKNGFGSIAFQTLENGTHGRQNAVANKQIYNDQASRADIDSDVQLAMSRPDLLTVSSSTRLPPASNFSRCHQLPPSENHELQTPLISYKINDYVVLADEALADVCCKAQKLALSQLEQEAEFELECYSRDKHYYDILEKRQTERQRDGAYSRFRTEGKNFAEKIQNKFVDAYAVMKQGKSEKTTSSVDHYKRKLEGDPDVQNIMDSTRETIYVNVIVKNSIRVVSHELDRLARQRWEERKQNEGNKDVRNGESRAQFEKFKAVAQGQLVQLAGLALASDFTPRRIAVQLSNDLYR